MQTYVYYYQYVADNVGELEQEHQKGPKQDRQQWAKVTYV
jgi:hypothetical protein